jgi:conjugative transfer pilus assembly protein TraH
MRKKQLLLMPLLVMALSVEARAGWMDDWMAQNTHSDPSYFEGQKRGYASAGGISGRWESGNDHPVSFTSPRIKSGCGGVDIMWGSMSFLNPDMLVKKFQRMIANAPAIAFDMALKALSDQLSTSLGKFDSLLNQLNAIQLDDCKASRAVMTTAVDMASKAWQGQDAMGAITDSAMADGAVDLYDSAKGVGTAVGGDVEKMGTKITGMTGKGLLDGCPQTPAYDDYRAMLSSGQTMLQYFGEKRGVDASYTDLIRGMFGDIGITSAFADGAFVYFMPPCTPQQSDDPETLVNGRVLTQNSNGVCSNATPSPTSTNLEQLATAGLTRIQNAMQQKSALSPDDLALIDSTKELPVYLFMKLAVQTGNTGWAVGKMSRLIARAKAYRMLKDLAALSGEIMVNVAVNMENLSGVDGGGKDETGASTTCSLTTAVSLKEQVLHMHRLVQEASLKAAQLYIAGNSEAAVMSDFMQEMQSAQNDVSKAIYKNFGAAVQRRYAAQP